MESFFSYTAVNFQIVWDLNSYSNLLDFFCIYDFNYIKNAAYVK